MAHQDAQSTASGDGRRPMGECDWFKTAALRALLTVLTEVDIDAGASATNCHRWALVSHRREGVGTDDRLDVHE